MINYTIGHQNFTSFCFEHRKIKIFILSIAIKNYFHFKYYRYKLFLFWLPIINSMLSYIHFSHLNLTKFYFDHSFHLKKKKGFTSELSYFNYSDEAQIFPYNAFLL